MNKFSAYRITNASLLKNYIFGAFIRYKAGTLQDALIIRFRDVMHHLLQLVAVREVLCESLKTYVASSEEPDSVRPRRG